MRVSERFAWILLILCCAFVAEADETMTISAMKGDCVTLHTGVGEMDRDTQILWLFGPEDPDTVIAEIYKLSVTIFDSHEGLKDSLQMNQQTGSLTISNITSRHSGLYTAQIMTAVTVFKTFHLVVYDYREQRLQVRFTPNKLSTIETSETETDPEELDEVKLFSSAPVALPIIESSSLVSECPISELQKCANVCFGHLEPSGGFPCALRCSAENGPGVSLSWYKGRERLNQTSNPELSVNLSLPLEITERNNDVYHCVAANAVSNKTTQVSFQEHCPRCTDCSQSCGFTEAVIRLVISGLVGVAVVAILVYDVRSGVLETDPFPS